MKRYLLLLGCLGMLACQPPQKEIPALDAQLIHTLTRELIYTISEDNFPPPVASRIYAYTQVAAYEALQPADSTFPSLNGQLTAWSSPTAPSGLARWDQAMVRAFCEVGRHLVYRDFMLDSVENQLLAELGPIEPAALQWGDQIAEAVKKWADEDGYPQTRNLPRYEIKKEAGSWEPTAPTFGEALEPYWAQHRPFVMDSTSQFRRPLEMTFSEQKSSPFYQAALEIKQIVERSDSQDIATAVYWDCNPGPLMVNGHVMQMRKQNTPGGHWMGINQIVCQQRELSLLESTAVYAKLAVGIADGFMAAWDTKFAFDLIRPETYINRYIDPNWRPKLESPLFPEYSSAHSLISGVAATILSEAHGEQMRFTDTTNVYFGLPSRSFHTFWEAAEEAANSRILGGIHYQFGCDAGLEQGRKLGAFVREEVDTY